jgi:adenylosuccinate lyase
MKKNDKFEGAKVQTDSSTMPKRNNKIQPFRLKALLALARILIIVSLIV